MGDENEWRTRILRVRLQDVVFVSKAHPKEEHEAKGRKSTQNYIKALSLRSPFPNPPTLLALLSLSRRRKKSIFYAKMWNEGSKIRGEHSWNEFFFVYEANIPFPSFRFMWPSFPRTNTLASWRGSGKASRVCYAKGIDTMQAER